jgi:hypothetical protein
MAAPLLATFLQLLTLRTPALQHGRTPLHVAAQNGCLDVVLLLLDKGAKTEAADEVGAMHVGSPSPSPETTTSVLS